MSRLTNSTCVTCKDAHGSIVEILAVHVYQAVNEHVHCQCYYVPMRTLAVGHATSAGYNGADAYLIYKGTLPEGYVLKEDAYAAGWKQKGGHKHLSRVLPGKMIGGDPYINKDGKLPSAPGRQWCEADIDYTGGKRNDMRILYSNDGLVFVTYDHYHTFYEVTR